MISLYPTGFTQFEYRETSKLLEYKYKGGVSLKNINNSRHLMFRSSLRPFPFSPLSPKDSSLAASLPPA